MASYLLAENNIANGFGENKLFMKMFHFAIYGRQKGDFQIRNWFYYILL